MQFSMLVVAVLLGSVHGCRRSEMEATPRGRRCPTAPAPPAPPSPSPSPPPPPPPCMQPAFSYTFREVDWTDPAGCGGVSTRKEHEGCMDRGCGCKNQRMKSSEARVQPTCTTTTVTTTTVTTITTTSITTVTSTTSATSTTTTSSTTTATTTTTTSTNRECSEGEKGWLKCGEGIECVAKSTIKVVGGEKVRGFVPYCIPLGFVVCPVQDDGGCDQTNLCIVNATDASSGSICQSTTATTTTSTATTVTLPTATSTIDITSVNGTANFGSPGFDSKGAASVSAEGSRDVNDDIDESFDEVELINLLVSDLSTQDASNRNVVAGVIITVVILAIIIAAVLFKRSQESKENENVLASLKAAGGGKTTTLKRSQRGTGGASNASYDSCAGEGRLTTSTTTATAGRAGSNPAYDDATSAYADLAAASAALFGAGGASNPTYDAAAANSAVDDIDKRDGAMRNPAYDTRSGGRIISNSNSNSVEDSYSTYTSPTLELRNAMSALRNSSI